MLPSHHVTSQVIAVCSNVATCLSIYLLLSFNDITARFYLMRCLSTSLSLSFSFSLSLSPSPSVSLPLSFIFYLSLYFLSSLSLSVYMIFMTIILAISYTHIFPHVSYTYVFLCFKHFILQAENDAKKRFKKVKKNGFKFPVLFDALVFIVIPVNIVKWLFPHTH